MRQDFDRDYIEHELTKIGNVSHPIDIYMLGGGGVLGRYPFLIFQALMIASFISRNFTSST